MTKLKQKTTEKMKKNLDLLLKYYHKAFKRRHGLRGYTDFDM